MCPTARARCSARAAAASSCSAQCGPGAATDPLAAMPLQPQPRQRHRGRRRLRRRCAALPLPLLPWPLLPPPLPLPCPHAAQLPRVPGTCGGGRTAVAGLSGCSSQKCGAATCIGAPNCRQPTGRHWKPCKPSVAIASRQRKRSGRTPAPPLPAPPTLLDGPAASGGRTGHTRDPVARGGYPPGRHTGAAACCLVPSKLQQNRG